MHANVGAPSAPASCHNKRGCRPAIAIYNLNTMQSQRYGMVVPRLREQQLSRVTSPAPVSGTRHTSAALQTE